jgi:quinol monooxygenase YgiN
MVVFTLSVVIPKSRRTDFVQSVSALLGPTRVAPGCMGCRLYADFENRNAFTLVEEWTTQAALDRHLASDAYKTLVAAIELSAQPPTIYFDTVGQRGGLEVIEAARRSVDLL